MGLLRGLIVPAIVALLLAPSLAHAYAFGEPLDSYAMFANEGAIPADVPSSVGYQLGPDNQTFKLFGGIGPLDGARFQPIGLAIGEQGNFAGPISPGDKLALDLNFDVNVTGGQAAWSVYAYIWSNEGFEEARILTRDTPQVVPPSGEVRDVHLESNAFENSGETGIAGVELDITWTNYAPTDTITLSIPDHSIDLSYAAVPEPSSLALIPLAALTLRSRRIRMQAV